MMRVVMLTKMGGEVKEIKKDVQTRFRRLAGEFLLIMRL